MCTHMLEWWDVTVHLPVCPVHVAMVIVYKEHAFRLVSNRTLRCIDCGVDSVLTVYKGYAFNLVSNRAFRCAGYDVDAELCTRDMLLA